MGIRTTKKVKKIEKKRLGGFTNDSKRFILVVSTGRYLMFTYSEDLFSDFHKDTYGFRPSGYDPFYDATPERKQEIWDQMEQDFLQEMVREEKAKAEAIIAFEDWIEKCYEYADGRPSREDVLRWMTEGEKFYHQQDVEHWVWEQGILFTDYGKELVKELMNIVTFEEWEAA